MVSSGLGICLSVLLLLLVPVIIIQATDLHVVCSNDKGNYTTGSVYQRNLNSLLLVLISYDTISNGYGLYNSSSSFYSSSLGQINDDVVYVLGLCRPDLKANVSLNLFRDSARNLTGACPNHKEAIVWNDYCMVRYSNRSFQYGNVELSPSYNQSTTKNLSWSTDVDSFNQQLKDFMGSLKSQAAAGSFHKKFAAESTRATYSNSQSISGIVQCSPDLSEENYSRCLDEGLGRLQKCCYGMDSARFGNPSCNLRYEVYSSSDPAKFDQPRVFSPITPPSGGNKESGKSRSAGTAIVGSMVLIISIYIFRRVKKKKSRQEEEAEEINSEALQFHFRSIRAATNKFSEANKLGRGGFGVVYRGVDDNKDIAVKRLSTDSAQGDIEFKTEWLGFNIGIWLFFLVFAYKKVKRFLFM